METGFSPSNMTKVSLKALSLKIIGQVLAPAKKFG